MGGAPREMSGLVSRCRVVCVLEEARWTTRSQSKQPTQAGRHDEADEDSEEQEEEEEGVVCRLRCGGSCVERKDRRHTWPGMHASVKAGERGEERRTTTMPRAWVTRLPELAPEAKRHTRARRAGERLCNGYSNVFARSVRAIYGRSCETVRSVCVVVNE